VHAEKIELLEPPLGRVLDVGCAEGASAEVLREQGASSLVGIEIDAAFAAAAASRYDEVVVGSVPEGARWPAASFDTVLCYDVLEHLVDPWSAIRALAALLVPGGRMHVSLPNARSKALWGPLLLRGRFAYEPEGVMDVTHLRFFARRDALDLVSGAGLDVVRVDHPAPETWKRRLAGRMTAGRALEFLTVQWFVLGVKPR
jgi:2-polyprenyl-3-methyl-5-hydroxy-6-metoxy-1,4-benzoquinol methylase